MAFLLIRKLQMKFPDFWFIRYFVKLFTPKEPCFVDLLKQVTDTNRKRYAFFGWIRGSKQ